MRLQDLWALLKDSWNAWSTDKVPRPSPPPTARPHYASDATEREKRVQPKLQTLRNSHAQFCRWHGYRGKTPRAIFLTSLVLVLHKSGVRKETYVAVR